MQSFSTPLADAIFSFLLIFLPFILGFSHAIFKRGKKIDYILLYYIVISVGIQGLVSGIMQTFYSDFVTQYVHWPFSPFMLELGLANISYGILGVLSLRANRGWQTATAFGYALFLLFTGIRHVIEIMEKGVNPGNSGSFMYVDNILPYIFFVLLVLRYREEMVIKASPVPIPIENESNEMHR